MVQSQFFCGELLFAVMEKTATDSLTPPRSLAKLACPSPLALQTGRIREAIIQNIVLAIG